MNPDVPQPVWAVLRALHLDRSAPPPLPEAWDQALAFADRNRLTLAWRARLAGSDVWCRVPESVRRRLNQNLADNTERQRRSRPLWDEITGRFAGAGVEFVTLKGFTHSPAFVRDPNERVQYDLDFYCPTQEIYSARDLLTEMGYEPGAELENLPVDHLPTMIRKTGWRWRGNYFDPDHPPSIDLHFRLWDFETERFDAPGVERFWDRRVGHTLDLVDQLGYAALHAVRHLFRGSLSLHHIYEIACFLKTHIGETAFWRRWMNLHCPQLRQLESIAFGLAQHWFGSPNPNPQPPTPAVQFWLDGHSWSPIEGMFHANKRELLLHWTLVQGAAGRWKVLRRRLFPFRLPGPVEAVYIPDAKMTPALWAEKWAKYAAFLASRLLYHARVLFPTLWMLLRWRGGSR